MSSSLNRWLDLPEARALVGASIEEVIDRGLRCELEGAVHAILENWDTVPVPPSAYPWINYLKSVAHLGDVQPAHYTLPWREFVAWAWALPAKAREEDVLPPHPDMWRGSVEVKIIVDRPRWLDLWAPPVASQRKQRGRPPKHPWVRAVVEIFGQIYRTKISEQSIHSIADAADQLREWFIANTGDEPPDSTLRECAAILFEELSKGR